MPFSICVVPVCPVRAEAAHRSEQVSQLLFGETCELLETAKDFVRIKCSYDNYEGWCQASQLEDMPEVVSLSENKAMAGEWVNMVRVNNQQMHVPYGSALGFCNKGETLAGQFKILYDGVIVDPGRITLAEESIRKIAFEFINTPYLWGGRSIFGIDCSGFTQMVFKFLNIKLQRDAYQQATQGEAVGFLQEVKCGDLAFFDNEAGKITHVGILLDAATIIHSSGKVRVDTMDNLGIVNSDTGKRTHKLRVIKRVVAWLEGYSGWQVAQVEKKRAIN